MLRAQEQVRADRSLQRVDVTSDRRPGQPEPTRSSRKRSLLHDRQEDAVEGPVALLQKLA